MIAGGELLYAVEREVTRSPGLCVLEDLGQGKYGLPYVYVVNEYGRQITTQYQDVPPAIRRPVLHYRRRRAAPPRPPIRRVEALWIRRHRNTQPPRTNRST